MDTVDTPRRGRRRRLQCGPFATGLAVTIIAADGAAHLCGAAYRHWWFWPAAVLSAVVVLLLAASAIAALLTPWRNDANIR